ncbi:LuxR C-terminal-related transcriptional regulator [Ramlibacter sp. 2FC]|uniref:helix-turn-helix transcriptional regulator n=1 Tax=Ramlibacter sp. 2FC TaxID=2502188 RepID=UPI001485B145|nr:LuxR C-terminal-related transcriptional regulator [Ramlibacter sp. 2FC]
MTGDRIAQHGATDESRGKAGVAQGAAAAPCEVACIDIAGQTCHLLCVDGVLPKISTSRNGSQPKLSYARDELANFELDGHRYVLVKQEAPSAPEHDPTLVPDDVCRLLTNRELQIVQLICMGCLTKQVAARLRLSEFTVRSYLKTIYCKLGVRSRGAMVYRYAQAFKHKGPDGA